MKKIVLLGCFLLVSFYAKMAFAQDWNQVIKAVASDRGFNDQFGRSVAISGDWAIVGAHYEDEDASGGGTMSRAGSAYIFKRDTGGNWTQTQKIVAGDRAVSDQFGWSVAISGDRAIVGAYEEDHDASGGGTLTNAGSAYIFERDTGGNWTQTQKIVAGDRAVSDQFGYSVAISGDRAIVGAYREDHDASGGGTLTNAGSAYIFERNTEGNWTQTQKIAAGDRAAGDYFGFSVAISGDRAIVGAYYEDQDASGGGTMWDAGSAYIFERNTGGNWTQTQKIVAGDRAPYDYFGWSVAISGDWAIVGARDEEHDASGGGTMSDAGSAYIFERNTGGNWTQTQKIAAGDRAARDWFGYSVAISGDRAIVGAYREDHDASGGDTLTNAGSAYIFERDAGGNWTQTQKIAAGDRAGGDYFGWSVAISDGRAIVGAHYEDEDASGDNTLGNAGSAYVFERVDEVTIPAGNTDVHSFSNTGVDIQFNGSGNTEELTLTIRRIEIQPNGALPGMVVNVSPRYWTATEVSGTVGGGITYNITLDLTGIPGIQNCENLHVLKRENDGDPWENITQPPHNGVLVYNCPNSIIVTLVASGFSEFAIGGSSDNPLPVELAGFSGVSTSNGIELRWTTHSETNNQGFILKRNGVEIADYGNTRELEGHGTTMESQRYSYTDKDVSLNETYEYKLTSVDESGLQHSYPQTVEVKVAEASATGQPEEYGLAQNYPNPFNPSTTIKYTMKEAGKATLKVYDVLGRMVFEQTLASVKGENLFNFNGSGLTSGMYYYQLNAEGFSKTLKMMLVK